MQNLEKFKNQCKIYAGCFGGVGIVLAIMAAYMDGQYAEALSDSIKCPSVYDAPAPSNAPALMGIAGICAAAAGIAILALVAANLLIAYRKDVDAKDNKAND